MFSQNSILDSFEGITLFTHPHIHEYVRRSGKAGITKAEGS